MTPLIAAAGLSKHYPRRTGGWLRGQTRFSRAVDDVSLSIARGETLGLVGESGCGKSTFGRLLIRLIEPTSGSVRLDGTDITALHGAALREHRRAMQIIFQDPYGALNPRMSVEDIIAEPLIIHGGRAGAATSREVGRLLGLVGLPERARALFPHEFSGGQRQRIGIARALVLRPKFVVCDEPVSALDVSVQAQIVNLLAELQAELGLTYLFIAHDLAVVKHISTRVAVMYLGKVVELADKAALYTRPLHPYTQQLITSVPIVHPRLRHREVKRLNSDLSSPSAPLYGCKFHTRCPHVMPICREQEPRFSEPARGHLVTCHMIK